MLMVTGKTILRHVEIYASQAQHELSAAFMVSPHDFL